MVIVQTPRHSIPQKGRCCFSNPEHTALEKVWGRQGSATSQTKYSVGSEERKGRSREITQKGRVVPGFMPSTSHTTLFPLGPE